jgi:hypothetical protein
MELRFLSIDDNTGSSWNLSNYHLYMPIPYGDGATSDGSDGSDGFLRDGDPCTSRSI